MEELKLITNALDLANQKGAFTLKDSYAIANALGDLTEKFEELSKLKDQANAKSSSIGGGGIKNPPPKGGNG